MHGDTESDDDDDDGDEREPVNLLTRQSSAEQRTAGLMLGMRADAY